MQRITLTQSVPDYQTDELYGLHAQPKVIIVLRWLCHMRWLAVMGQTLAIALGDLVLQLPLPMAALSMWVGAAFGSNLLLSIYLLKTRAAPQVLVPLVLLLDVLLLTGVLANTGGANNPFAVFYLIHVAMAVVVARPRWSWVVLLTTLLCDALIFRVPDTVFENSGLSSWVLRAGQWTALALTAIVITYFVGRLRTTLRRREKQIASMAQRMNRSDRLASLTALAAGAAHELGSPLGTIMLAASELEHQAQTCQSPMQIKNFREDLALIAEQAQRCRRILDSMNADTVRQADEQPTVFSVDELIGSLSDELQPVASDRLVIQNRLLDHVITARKHTLIQALTILLHNAFDASTVSDQFVTFTIQKSDRHYQFIVQDQGFGINDEQMQHLGEPFRTDKGPQQGMGLGLFLARLMTEQLHGRLTLHSALGKGTIAVLQFDAKS
ncbi:MAG: HAMP domain-containing histidine kinase [Phycisphaeraceae bacterium]|nr:HAMP domain-containing histidine kinase [Phycisphaeraceae bacterium]